MRRAISAVGATLAAVGLGGCCGDDWLAALVGCSDMAVSVKADRQRVETRERVNFEGRVQNVDGDIAQIAWDYDGDLKADRVDRMATPPFTAYLPAVSFASHTYLSPGSYRVGFMALSTEDELKTASTDVEVVKPAEPRPNEPPTASISAPEAVPAGDEFEVDGSRSDDLDGRIVRYRWDFDDDGTIDVDSDSPFARHTYYTLGPQTVRLGVEDDRGATDTTTATIYVGEGRPEPGVRGAAVPRTFTATLRGRPLGGTPDPRQRGAVSRRRGLGAGKVRVRLSAPRLPGDRALGDLLGGRWRTRLRTRFNRDTLLARLDGIALTRPARKARRRERGCVVFSLSVPAFAPPTGTIRLLGGTRRYARLRASGAFTPTVGSGSALDLAGTINVRRASARGLPKRCRKLERLLRQRGGEK
jgi:hypothetical protein